MSHTTPGEVSPEAYGRDPDNRTSLTKVGGSLGIIACITGVAIFTLACFGNNAVFMLSFIPLAVALVGMVLSVLGGIWKDGVDEIGPLAGIFLNLFGIIGGLLLVAAWQDWAIFYRTPVAM